LEANLKMKAGPTKTAMMFFEGSEMPEIPLAERGLMVGPDPVPIVEHYKYLGRAIDHRPINDTVITSRIGCAWAAVNKLAPVWGCGLRLELKERLFECFVRPSISFSCQSWQLTKKQLHRLDVVFTRMRRKAFGIEKFTDDSHTKCVSLREIHKWRGRVGPFGVAPEFSEPISATIIRKRLNLLGHVMRHDVPMRDIIMWEPPNKRIRGGRRWSLFDTMLQDLRGSDTDRNIRTAERQEQKTPSLKAIDFERLYDLASDRRGWHRQVDIMVEAATQKRLGVVV
jgi:hypothetical protein